MTGIYLKQYIVKVAFLPVEFHSHNPLIFVKDLGTVVVVASTLSLVAVRTKLRRLVLYGHGTLC